MGRSSKPRLVQRRERAKVTHRFTFKHGRAPTMRELCLGTTAIAVCAVAYELQGYDLLCGRAIKRRAS